MANMLFMAYDGDDAGKLVGRAVLADDVNGLHEISQRIASGHDVVQLWVEQNGGQVISGGGDEGTFQIPQEALQTIEQLRADYQFATQLTATIGVGATLSESGKALMVGKFRGKNQVLQYDPSMDQELATVQANVAAGGGSDEEKKISEAYLQAPAAAAPAAEPHCQYCAETEHEHVDDDCVLCQENAAEQAAPAADDCNYCEETDAAAPLAESEDAHCAYCEEAEMAAAHDHGDDCQYCREAESAPAAASNPDCQYCQEAAQNAGPGVPAEAAVDGIVNDDPNTQSERDQMNAIDASSVAALDPNMEGNVSRPDGYDGDAAPTDLGLTEDGAPTQPDLSEVLQDGLDSHQDQIQKEKVMNMVGQALQGFKGQKHILERAQQAAPELYSATIMMLKAMIEMGKMLGLQPKEQAQPEQSEPAPQAQPAAAQGDAAQAPQQ